MSFFEEQCPEMDRYLENNASQEPEHLKRLRRETYHKTTQPHMLSGYQQGRLLTIISKMMSPRNVLEIGTFTGYATLCLAEGLVPDGKITTLDVNDELAYIPGKYFEESPHSAKINFIIQDALDYLEQTDEFFDLVFIDADKENYVSYWNLIKPRLRSGSVVLLDNVLWYGKVLADGPVDEATRQIIELNDLVARDSDFENLILPLRDGINLIRKK
ncbi:class I SAM-dependent methyltransferase [Marnyiella aurantia]|uniref:Class I SAM-dependent methyltransferase n=1 Tax=Marnyiella aurantia TaxID=2758037 RepID=A0A7D7LNC9_9FLAO|nr:class I SAM-dependent methyltransferase [Marnyiella aurantia]MBA5247732.1 class I SAM-dependent methyltransferase [Marnyiella aurantia]QMS97316.1 class I SAM-dependent methyltransferase [Marnyiella aurantia]